MNRNNRYIILIKLYIIYILLCELIKPLQFLIVLIV